MKYDWIALEREFTTGKKCASMSLREFARYKGIPLSAYYAGKTRGWLEKRAEKQRRKSMRIEETLTEKEIDREVALNERHYAVWERFTNVIEQAFSSGDSMTAMCGNDSLSKALNRLAAILEKVQKGQRTALGMDKEKPERNETGETDAIESVLAKLQERKVEGEEGGKD